MGITWCTYAPLMTSKKRPIGYWTASASRRGHTAWVTCDVWHVTCDVWRVTCDVWRVTCDVRRVTCNVWRDRSSVAASRIAVESRPLSHNTKCTMFYDVIKIVLWLGLIHFVGCLSYRLCWLPTGWIYEACQHELSDILMQGKVSRNPDCEACLRGSSVGFRIAWISYCSLYCVITRSRFLERLTRLHFLTSSW